jgi:hypothetical protein
MQRSARKLRQPLSPRALHPRKPISSTGVTSLPGGVIVIVKVAHVRQTLGVANRISEGQGVNNRFKTVRIQACC